MSDSQPNQPPPKANAPPPRPPQKASPNNATESGPFTSSDVAANMPNFTFGEMVDLALCAPEVGAVNFNILRLLLREMIEKTGIANKPVRMTDLEAHQVDNFKNYVQGAAVASPMPGVLKIAPGSGGGAGMAYGVKPGAMGPDSNKALLSTSAKPRTPKTGFAPTGGQTDASYGDNIPEKVARLERHLEALYQLPGNAEILERAKDQMSVNDMWQIIQLNNRIAAAEAAIQKMASLIEDLARNMNRVKGDTKSMKKDATEIQLTNSDLQIQGQTLSDKCEQFGDVVRALRDDMDRIKKGWKKDRDLLEKTLGVDLGRVPSFMKTKMDRDVGTTGTGTYDDSAEQFERGTQTFVHLKDKEKQQAQAHRPPPPKHQAQPAQRQHDAETYSQPQQKGHPQQQQRHPKQKPAEAMIPPETIANMTPEDMMKQITAEEVAQIPPEMFKKMSSEQRKVLRDIYKQGHSQTRPQKPQLNVRRMTAQEIEQLEPDKIEIELSYEEATLLGAEDLEKMNENQRQAVQKVIQKGPGAKQQAKKQKPKQPPKPPMGLATMSDSQLATISIFMITLKLPYEEAVNIPPEVLSKMTQEQRAAVQKIIDAGSAEAVLALEGEDDEDADDDFLILLEQSQTTDKKKKSKRKSKPLTSDELLNISKIAPEDLAATLTPEMALNIPDDELKRRFTPAQIEEIIRLKSIAPLQKESQDSLEQGPSAEETSQFPLPEITSTEFFNMTAEQMAQMTDEQVKMLALEKQEAVKDARKSRRQTQVGEEEEEGEPTTDAEEMYDDDEEGGHGHSRKSKKDKPAPMRHRGTHHKHRHHHHHADSHVSHPHVDVVQGPIPIMGEPLPPMSLEEYLATLPPEEAANLAADAVQRELQKQYTHLQGMQRQLAQDIQDKMEFIYQKLLKEIAAQQLTTSPYMAVGGPDECLGPGVCTGHGMPAGIAVVQFPELKEKAMALVPAGAAVAGGLDTDGKVCPGPGICPGSAICPYCRAQGGQAPVGGTTQEALQVLRAPDKNREVVSVRGAPQQQQGQAQMLSEMDEAVLREMKSLMMLDLEKIREEMRFKKFGAFDEQDMVERLGAVWEALKILKHNEEALAIKIARQDALLKKLPMKLVEKLSKIPEENLDAMVTGQFDKLMVNKRGTQKDLESTLPRTSISKPPSAADKEDVQTLFNNLANVIAECTEQKDRVDQLADTTRIMESGMVTKQMLLDALSDKADKGLINTKVSYDEFGNTVDELHTQLHNLMMEGYQRNENWKKVTSELAEDLAEKLDKTELAPIRAFFKSHLKNLEEKVKTLSQLVEEPDPAGTRKRLLRDYNCLSCDRMVNISGVTNGPTLPTIGPILAGHTTASRRALDLHRMRMRKQFDCDTKNLNALERQNRGQKCGTIDPTRIACDIDVMNVVNRYTGGSHTAINTADRIATQRRPSTGLRALPNPAPIVSGGGAPNTSGPGADAVGGGENVAG